MEQRTREYRVPPDADGVRAARGHVRDALASITDPETLGRVELVVSELVTNSVRHGPGHPITLRLAASDAGEILGTVEDQGAGVVALRDQDRSAIGGLGLVLVDALTTAWGVHPDSTHVWFKLAATG
ncbi:MAG TPA: ATP-binding protein [Thermoleophilaceae bacterium]